MGAFFVPENRLNLQSSNISTPSFIGKFTADSKTLKTTK